MVKVLIVEDDPMVAQINKSYIESVEGFKVLNILKDGKEALEFLDENHVDLIILDIYMPRVDGLSFLMELRKRLITCDVIMVTAAKEVEKIQDAMELGVLDYLIKPFEYERLKRSLENYKLRKKLYKTKKSLGQEDIDSIIGVTSLDDVLPKGLNEITMDKILLFIGSNRLKSMTADEIAKEVGVTNVTIRRYMNYLETRGIIKRESEYGSLGRPCYRYRYIKNIS